MSEAKFTVGPPVDSMSRVMHRTIRDESGFIVAWVNKFAETHGDKQDAKNAAMLAASPELYESSTDYLKESELLVGWLLDKIGDDLDDMDRVQINKYSQSSQKLQAAINKAEGK